VGTTKAYLQASVARVQCREHGVVVAHVTWAYLLKEQLREVFRIKGIGGRRLLAGWLSWASHSRIPEFVTLARSIRRYKELIGNTLDHGLSNARSEATNTHLRALTKRAYGFHSPEALIAMALLTRGGLCPLLPGRAA